METTTLRAFHNNPKVKSKYLARVKAHEKADEIIKGTYWQGGKGCAVGCTIHRLSRRPIVRDDAKRGREDFPPKVSGLN